MDMVGCGRLLETCGEQYYRSSSKNTAHDNKLYKCSAYPGITSKVYCGLWWREGDRADESILRYCERCARKLGLLW